MTRSIDLTVAAVVERNDRFLVVEEVVSGCQVFNQPAGHVEPGETLIEAVIREAREETGYRFHPSGLLGIYYWQEPNDGRVFLRIAVTGTAVEPASTPMLDNGILGVFWYTRRELRGLEARMRSPMVLQCIDDYIAGAGYPLDALVHLLPDIETLAKSA